MAVETSVPRSRRALLAGGLGGLAALIASALGRPLTVRAGTDGDVVLGAMNSAGFPTIVENTGTQNAALEGRSMVVGGIGVQGTADAATGSNYGVWGETATGNSVGVYGMATAATGNPIGVCGISPGTAGTGVFGTSTAQTGVLGYSGIIGMGAPAPATRPKTGVFGYAAQDAGSRGVIGESPAGIGVLGQSGGSGTGVRAYNTNAAGLALLVTGRAGFSRSGRASVAINASYVDITVPGGLDSSANVLATLQAYRSGVYVAAVQPNYPSTGKARIYLNKVASTTVTTPVAWFVLG